MFLYNTHRVTDIDITNDSASIENVGVNMISNGWTGDQTIGIHPIPGYTGITIARVIRHFTSAPPIP